MHHKSIRLRTKMAIYQVALISTLQYGAEAWNTTSQEEKRLAAFHTRCLRRIFGVSWRDYVSNAEIFKRTGQAPLINIPATETAIMARPRRTYASNTLTAPPIATPLDTIRTAASRQACIGMMRSQETCRSRVSRLRRRW